MDDEQSQMTDHTAKWLAAAMLTLAATINKYRRETHIDVYEECESFYERMFGGE